MSEATFRRIVWSATLLCGVLVWTFAIIGIRATLAECPHISVWSAAERPFLPPDSHR